MTQTIKSVIVVICDLLIVLISLLLSYALLYRGLGNWAAARNNFIIYLIFCGCAVIPNAALGTYTFVFRYAGLADALRQCAASLISLALALSVSLLLPFMPSLTTIIICTMFELIFMGFMRFSGRIFQMLPLAAFVTQRRKNVSILFTGIDNAIPIMDKLHAESTRCRVAAVVDKLPRRSACFRLQRARLPGGGYAVLENALRVYKPAELIIDRKDLKELKLPLIIRLCTKYGCRLRMYNGIEDFSGQPIRDIKLEDLLGRSPVCLDVDQIRAFIRDKIVLVTGGAGSIGSEICRQALTHGCRRLIVLDICENALFELDHELIKSFGKGRHEIVVGSIRDMDCLNRVFSTYRPQIVFHAAAHKHVPLMELNPEEAIINNICGTQNTANAALNYGVERFVLISTDKAVKPANTMGATKRVAEMLIQSLSAESTRTIFTAVRFGNVLGSNGSVIPLFQKQIREGGPVTVTHPQMERYFMTISEAAQLVMQAGAMASGGEIYVLEMGKQIKIIDLANELIRLSGMENGRDIKIEFTGLRPGEKLSEELIRADETKIRTNNPKIYMCSPAEKNRDFMSSLKQFQASLCDPDCDCKAALMDFVRRQDQICIDAISLGSSDSLPIR